MKKLTKNLTDIKGGALTFCDYARTSGISLAVTTGILICYDYYKTNNLSVAAIEGQIASQAQSLKNSVINAESTAVNNAFSFFQKAQLSNQSSSQ